MAPEHAQHKYVFIIRNNVRCPLVFFKQFCEVAGVGCGQQNALGTDRGRSDDGSTSRVRHSAGQAADIHAPHDGRSVKVLGFAAFVM